MQQLPKIQPITLDPLRQSLQGYYEDRKKENMMQRWEAQKESDRKQKQMQENAKIKREQEPPK